MPRELMTELEFNTTCNRIKLREDYKTALYGHLVQGKTMIEMAKITGLTRQAINRKAKEFKSIKPYPPGWIGKHIWLPQKEMEAVTLKSAELLKNAGYNIKLTINITINVDKKSDIEPLIAGLLLASKDASDYVNACTPKSEEDRKTLAYWHRRGEVLKAVADQIENALAY